VSDSYSSYAAIPIRELIGEDEDCADAIFVPQKNLFFYSKIQKLKLAEKQPLMPNFE